jgi:hypothetical protein
MSARDECLNEMLFLKLSEQSTQGTSPQPEESPVTGHRSAAFTIPAEMLAYLLAQSNSSLFFVIYIILIFGFCGPLRRTTYPSANGQTVPLQANGALRAL